MVDPRKLSFSFAVCCVLIKKQTNLQENINFNCVGIEWIPEIGVFVDRLIAQICKLGMLCLCVTSWEGIHNLKNKIKIIFLNHSVYMKLMLDV